MRCAIFSQHLIASATIGHRAAARPPHHVPAARPPHRVPAARPPHRAPAARTAWRLLLPDGYADAAAGPPQRRSPPSAEAPRSVCFLSPLLCFLSPLPLSSPLFPFSLYFSSISFLET